jgi:hypothetical protein
MTHRDGGEIRIVRDPLDENGFNEARNWLLEFHEHDIDLQVEI